MKEQESKLWLTGTWRVCRKFKTNGTDEYNLIIFSGKGYIVSFPADGIITEMDGVDTTTTSYTYDSDKRVIDIQTTERTTPSPISGTGNNLFRIILLNDREVYFQKPHSVKYGNTDTEFELVLLERL